MEAERWRQIDQICQAAQALPESERAAFVAQACAGDEDLRREVESLLAYAAKTEPIMEKPAWEEVDWPPGDDPGLAGETVAHYRIRRKIGEGGQAVVYEAENLRLHSSVALKFLPDNYSRDQAALERFRREARAASACNHPNICVIHDIGEHDGRPFIVMELLAGQTLRARIAGRPLAISEVVDLGMQICGGLEAAHAKGIVHRDIKPGNIFISESASGSAGRGTVQAKILDFGLAKVAARGVTQADAPAAAITEEMLLTSPGVALGTVAYMSPEQALGEDLDERTDLFSLGVVLYEMTTGSRPFTGKTSVAVHDAILHATPIPPEKLNPEVPARLSEVILKALEKDRKRRYQSAAELRADLAEVKAGRRVLPRRWRRAGRMAGVAVLALAAVVAARWFFRPQDLPAEKRIAVLPVTSGETVMSPEQAVVGGLIENIISKLTQIDGATGKLVAMRTTKSVEAARRDYGSNLAITGSAQRVGDHIRVTLKLVNTATLGKIDARTLEMGVADARAGIRGVIQMLSLRVPPEMSKTIEAGGTANPAAYRAYLEGMGYLSRYDMAGNIDRAVNSLTQATKLDGGYAAAFAELGRAHWLRASNKSDPQERQLALASAHEAIRLSPNLEEAHLRLGEVCAGTGQTAEAIQEEQSVLGLNPGNAVAYRILGDVYKSKHQYDRAEAEYQQAVRRQPGDWYNQFQLGLFYMNPGRNQEARAAFEAADKLTPHSRVVYRNLAILDMQQGKFREASDRIAKVVVSPSEPKARDYAALGTAYYYQRRYEEAAAAFNLGLELDPNLYALWGDVGTVYQHLQGSEEKARRAFRKAIELAEARQKVVETDDTRANLAQYWAELGDGKKALAEIARIPESSRAGVADRLVLAYERTGNRRRAVETVKGLPPGNPLLIYLRNDPELEDLWRDPALRQSR